MDDINYPCKHETSRSKNEIGESVVLCDLFGQWMNVTLGECQGNCGMEERGDD